MTSHGASPRSTKRRKIDHFGPQEPAAAPQAVQAIKNAVLGRFSPFGYNAQNTRPTTQDAVVEGSHGMSYDADTEINGMEVDPVVDSAYDSAPARDELGDDENGVVETPSKSKRGLRAGKRQSTTDVGTMIDKGAGKIATPLKRKRKKYRAQSGSMGAGASTQGDILEGIARQHRFYGADGEDASVIGVGQVRGTFEAADGLERSDSEVGNEGMEAGLGITELKGNGELGSTRQDGVGKNKSDIEDSANNQRGRSSGRQRRKPRRYSTEMAESITVQHTPTASAGRPRGRKKQASAVVTVAEPEDELSLGFKDIPTITDPSEGAHPLEVPRLNLLPPEDAMQADEVVITPTKKRGRPPKAIPDVVLTPRAPLTLTVEQPTVVDNSRQSLNDSCENLRLILQGEGGEESLTAIKKHVLEGLTGKRRLPLVGLDAEYEKLHQLVEQTIVAGEGNSMLVIGARGTAKTNLVETVLSDLAALHHEDFYVVRLNGFIHTDDKLALREIWRQLGREMEVEDETMGIRSNYADTLASLLALLSHPAELAEVNADQAAKSVIFIMDEFDLFTTHPRQTLLYNLFDIAQSRKAPIAVLGLTTRVDVVESLEKRVKSRFSHRYVHLSLPKSFPAFQNICKSALEVLDPAFELSTSLTDSPPRGPHFSKLHHAWNAYISTLFSHSPPLTSSLLRTYHLSKSIPSFLTTCLLPLASLSPTHIPTSTSFLSNPLSPPDSKLHLLPGLSDLALALLIAAARLDIILDTDVCNFHMAYDEYQRVAARAKVQSSAAGAVAVGAGSKLWGKEVAMGAWEGLAGLELLMPAGGTGSGVGGGSGNGGGGAGGRMWRVDVGLEEIGPSVPGLGAVMARWCREI